MRKFYALFPILIVLLLVVGSSASAVSYTPLDRNELRSGAAIEPDLALLSVGLGSPSGTGPPPRVGPNILVNDPQVGLPDGLFGRSETTIAVTGNGQHLVAGWNDADGFCGLPFGAPCPAPEVPGLSGYAYSTDGGLTWVDGGAPPVLTDNAMTRGDPWMDSGGANGNTVYYANLAVDADTAASLGVVVHRGRFSGKSFEWYDAHVFDSPANAVTPGVDFYDKEALVASKDGSKAVYVTLTNFEETCDLPTWGWGTIELWGSHDGGDTWQGPAIVSPDQTFITDPNDPDCGAEGVLQQSSAPAIGPKDEVYVVFQYGPTFLIDGSTTPDADIVVARSLDGGLTFEPFVKVADINSMRQNPPVAYNRSRINDHPRIAVATSGPNRGRVYVTFYSAVSPVSGTDPTQQQLVSSQVFVSYSDDQGSTWSTPIPVAPPVPDIGVKRFWPDVTVQPNGNVDVIYYESLEIDVGVGCSASIGSGLFREGDASSLMDTYWAQSTDGGMTFNSPVKVSTVTSNWCEVASNIRPNMGDYIDSATGGNRVFPIWADGRNGVPDTFFSNIHGAGKSK
jgi:hypothetical protein